MTETPRLDAHRQYANRPKDERFPSVQALIAAGQYDKTHSAERVKARADLEVAATDGGLQLVSPHGAATFTHWSFAQLARALAMPAGHLRDLPPELAAEVMTAGLRGSAYRLPDGREPSRQYLGPRDDLKLLLKSNGGTPIVRACTAETYGRVWDATLYQEIQDRIMSDPQWRLPLDWSHEPAGAYRGDRDSFLITINGGSIVEDPSARGGDGQMNRGILVRNSEVGASSVTIECLYFRYICGNLMIWGAVSGGTFRRRHVGKAALRDTMREITRIARQWTEQSTTRDAELIKSMIAHEIAETKDGVIEELRKLGATKEQATAAYDACETREQASPRSYWGAAQGLTRISQESGYQDERYQIDRIAGALLARAAKLVTV